jgi:hypothetical protein
MNAQVGKSCVSVCTSTLKLLNTFVLHLVLQMFTKRCWIGLIHVNVHEA